VTVVASAVPDAGVTVAPWISSDGVGIVAHGGPLRDGEPAPVTAQRVARAAAQTYATLPSNGDAVATAKRSVLALLTQPGAQAYFELARRAVPNHPSWLAPWGDADGQASATHADLADRWRSLLRTPVRAAVIANQGEAQARAALSEIDRWLLVEARGRPCSAVAAAEGPERGAQLLRPPSEDSGRLLVAARANRGALFAEIARAALEGPGGALTPVLGDGERAAVHLLGGRRAQTLVVEVEARPARLPDARAKVLATLERLGKEGLSPAALERASARALTTWQRARSHPRERLAALWRDEPLTADAFAQVDAARLRLWLGQTLAPGRFVVVSEEPP
jgi:hypothetical protein